MNMIDLLLLHARERPDAPAIIDLSSGRARQLTFAALQQAVEARARQLWSLGLRPGDPVLLFQPISADLYVSLGAIFRLGLIAMVVDPAASPALFERCCALYPPRALIAVPQAHLLRLRSAALRRIPIKCTTRLPLPGTSALSRIKPERLSALPDPAALLDADTPALMTLTSGSTGEPKAIVRSHGFLLSQHRALSACLALKPGAINLATLPIFVLADLASGICSLIPQADLRRPGSIEAAPVIDNIQRYAVSSIVAAPAFLEQLSAYCLKHGLSLSSLETIYTGGAPVFPRLLSQLQAIAPRAVAMALYGSTEAEPIAQLSAQQITAADHAAMQRGSGLLAGYPVDSLELRIMPDRWGTPLPAYTTAGFQSACLPAGCAGEIVVSGNHVVQGYLDGQGNHETKFSVETTLWHRTGDAGYLDQHGRLWLLGRCSERISDERGRLYPFAVECAVAADPAVRRSALLGYQGRRLLALQAEQDAAQAAILARLASLDWAQIDGVQFYRRLPVDRRHNSKIDYPALRALVSRNSADTSPRLTF